MSKASELIERMERETGQRIDDNGGDNLAMDGLVGAMSRVMGQSPESYTEKEDVAAGVVINRGEKDIDPMVALMLAMLG